MRHRRKKVRKFVAKSQRSCTAFKVSQSDGFYSVYDRTCQSPALDELLHNPDELMAAGEMLKDGNSATVVRLKLKELDLVVKRYNIKDLKHAGKRSLRPSRAAVSWKMGQRLSWWRIATPKPVAMLEKRVLGLRSTAYFISEYVEGSLAYDLLRQPGLPAAELAYWSEQFAILLRRLRDSGLTHGDFKATNFLCGVDAKLYLIDLDAMRYWSKPGSAFKRAVKRDYKRLLANWQDMPEIERSFQNIIKNLQSDNF
jgi:serine/threonine protein kinase